MLERAEELGTREEYLMKLIDELSEVNKKLAQLKLRKDVLERELIETIGHDKEGARTYEVAEHTVTVKTDYIYALNKKSYVNGDVYLPSEFDPITQKTTYEVNKSLYKSYYTHAPLAVREALDKLVSPKPAKPSVKIGVRS